MSFTQKVLDDPHTGYLSNTITCGAVIHWTQNFWARRDIDSVNKHCEDYRVPLTVTRPVSIGNVSEGSERTGDFGIRPRTCNHNPTVWPMLIWLTALALTHVTNQKGLPEFVQGETAIARTSISVQGKPEPEHDALPSDISIEEARSRSESWKQLRQKFIPFSENAKTGFVLLADMANLQEGII